MVAVIGLSVAVVILATDDAPSPAAPPATSSSADSASTGLGAPSHTRDVASLRNGRRYDGGPEEGTRGIVVTQPPTIRYDGGPEEGSRGPGR
jgi:hypothetical protein